MIMLENWQYLTCMQGGYKMDTWRLSGYVWGHPEMNAGELIHTSTPVKLIGNFVKTASGRIYKLGKCAGDEKKQKQYIRDDIERKGSLHF